MGNGYRQDTEYVYENENIIVKKTEGNPFLRAAMELERLVPQDDSSIEVIIATYYDLILHYGNPSEYSIFNRLKLLSLLYFFIDYYKDFEKNNLNSFDQKIIALPTLKLAFFIKNSPGFAKDIPIHGGAAIGGSVVGKKKINDDTLLVFSEYHTQDYLGPSAYDCKQNGTSIDKFIFKKVDGNWKIFDFESDIDFWITTRGGNGQDNCKEINQDRIKKYQNF